MTDPLDLDALERGCRAWVPPSKYDEFAALIALARRTQDFDADVTARILALRAERDFALQRAQDAEAARDIFAYGANTQHDLRVAAEAERDGLRERCTLLEGAVRIAARELDMHGGLSVGYLDDVLARPDTGATTP